jgi:hypothetical protein
MTKLNQVVAIEKGVKNTVARDIDTLYKLIQKGQLLAGISRTYRPKDEEDGDQLPSESTLVQVKVPQVLEDVGRHLTALFDVVYVKDSGNTTARADVTIDGRVLVADAPVPYLLFLEKQLTDVQTVIRALPVLDPAESWTYDANTGAYRTGVIQTNKTKKVPRNHIKAAATDKHPAQVEMYYEDVNVGTWDTVKYSGAIPVDRRTQLTERIATLLQAVKFAREQANGTEVAERQCGAAIFSYLLAD